MPSGKQRRKAEITVYQMETLEKIQAYRCTHKMKVSLRV